MPWEQARLLKQNVCSFTLTIFFPSISFCWLQNSVSCKSPLFFLMLNVARLAETLDIRAYLSPLHSPGRISTLSLWLQNKNVCSKQNSQPFYCLSCFFSCSRKFFVPSSRKSSDKGQSFLT